MANVQDQAARLQLPDVGVHLAVVVDDFHVAAGEAVGEDVAWTQVGGDLVEGRWADADVGHQGEADAVGELPRFGEGGDADAAGGAGVDACLDAEDQVAVGIDDFRRQVDVPVVGVGELPTRRDEADRGEVEQGVGAAAGAVHDVLAEAGEGVGAGAADVEPGRHAAPSSDWVGLDAPVGDAPVDVSVEVDEARRHDMATGVDGLPRPGAGERWFDGGNPAVADADVEPPDEAAAGVDDLAAADDDVVALHGSSLFSTSPGPKVQTYRGQATPTKPTSAGCGCGQS